MNGKVIAEEYLRMVKVRLKAVSVLFEEKSFNDVIRKCQEIVELILKGLMRNIGVDPPRRHDIGNIVLENKDRLPENWKENLDDVIDLSALLAEERSVAFYGDETEGVKLSELYSEEETRVLFERTKKLVDLYETIF